MSYKTMLNDIKVTGVNGWYNEIDNMIYKRSIEMKNK